MTELEAKIKEYRQYARIMDEAKAMKEALADEIKAAMTAAGKQKMIVGEYKLSYTDVTSHSLDQNRLREAFGDLSAYMKTTTYKRFSVS